VPPIRHKALIALACVLVFGVFWVWPAFHQPADHTCPADAEDYWSYKVTSRTWDCGPTGWHVAVGDGVYGFPGI